ncbi:MAG: glycosyl transferase [Spirochaetaceae bacterium]|nr:glycosyl transferase [Spirochaetaceae bacterium]
MIPKKIHYCWFGGKPLPQLAKNCIESWKKNLPDYDIIEWNESNFDINCCEYVKESYQAKKWAFVSDYARLQILYNEGGIYFDTDVKIIRPFDDIIEAGNFMAMELPSATINLGLGFGVEKNSFFLQDMLEMYRKENFVLADGTYNQKTIVQNVTEKLLAQGLKQENTIQNIAGFTLYPTDYFCPYNYQNNTINITKNTCCIHLYDGSWLEGNPVEVKARQTYILWGYRNIVTKLFHKIYVKLLTVFYTLKEHNK